MLTILNSLRQVTYVYITLDCETKILKTYLSRLKLDFFLKKNVVLFKSKEFREIIVNFNQLIITLIKLINKFVFRNNTKLSRNVIVSRNNVQFESNNYYICVHIDTFIQYFFYYFYYIDF